MALKECDNTCRWKFIHDKQGGLLRKCLRCKRKIREIAVAKCSSLDGEYKVIRPKGKHRAKNSADE
jgi:hypothetical protein